MTVVDLETERARRTGGVFVDRELACLACGYAWTATADVSGGAMTDAEVDEAFSMVDCPKCASSPVLVLWRERMGRST